MNKSCLLVFVCTVSTLALRSQNGIHWSSPIEVAAASFGDDSPRIAVLPDGIPAVVWGRSGTSPKVFFSKLANGSFTAPAEINTGGVQPDIYGFGGLDMAIAGNSVFMVFENFNDGIHLVRSTDGGQTFDAPVSAFNPPPGIWATIPSIAANEAGNPLISVIQQLSNETQARYVFIRSEDGGLTFTAPVIASEAADGDFVCECCEADIMTQGTDQVWLIFRNNNNNIRDMWVSQSIDGGATFDTATDVDATDWMLNACPISGPKIARLAGDSLLNVWMSNGLGTNSIYLSTLHGGTMNKGWEAEFPHANAGSSHNNPDAAGSNDTVGVVWTESGFGVNHSDLMFAFSKLGAAGLTSNISNITNAPGNQRFPALAYADGIFHLVYANGFGALEYMKGTVTEVNAAREVAAAPHITVLGQPSKNTVHLKAETPMPGTLQASLLDLNGRKIRTWQGVRWQGLVTSLDIEGIEPGFYVLQCNAESRFISLKVIIEV